MGLIGLPLKLEILEKFTLDSINIISKENVIAGVVYDCFIFNLFLI